MYNLTIRSGWEVLYRKYPFAKTTIYDADKQCRLLLDTSISAVIAYYLYRLCRDSLQFQRSPLIRLLVRDGEHVRHSINLMLKLFRSPAVLFYLVKFTELQSG